MDSAGPLAPASTEADSWPEVEHANAAISWAMADDAEIDLSWIPGSASRSWAMAEDGLRFLTRVARAVRPRHVIEYGSGVSTALLLRESYEGGLGFHVSSVEHDPRYARETMRIVSDRILLPTFALSVAPLVGRVIRGRFAPTYYTKEIVPASSEPADLVLVDGPPSALGGRFGSIIQGLATSRRGAIVVIDDSARSGEQQALQAIADGFADAVELRHLAGFKRGMAVLIVRDPGPFASITTAWEPSEVPFQGDIGHQSDTFSRYAGRLSLTAEYASVPGEHRRPVRVAPNGPGTTGGAMVLYVVGGLARQLPGAEARDFPLLPRNPRETRRAHARRFSRLVEAAMAFGGTHLVVPRAHADWLAGHPHLIDYLKANHELVDADPESGLTFQLLERG